MLVSVVDVRDHQAQQQRSEAIAAVATWRAEGPDRGQWAALQHKAAEAMLVPKLEPANLSFYINSSVLLDKFIIFYKIIGFTKRIYEFLYNHRFY